MLHAYNYILRCIYLHRILGTYLTGILDWNTVLGETEKGYQGHFVPVVGYDIENVYVHNHGFKNPTAFLAIPREVFENARKVRGTDEDIAIIYRKQAA